jgi:predicted AAA+ superfamily ATPase
MAIKPKHSIANINVSPKATRHFTDREEFIKIFENKLESNTRDEHNVLVFYGVGGVGKSTLRKELGKLLDLKYKDTIFTSIDL